MKLTRWHLVVWFSLAAIAASVAVWACIRYNEVAGTDKTPDHIALIAAGVITGPMVGPIANPAATSERPVTMSITAVLCGGLLLSILPFRFVKRPVSRTIRALSWTGFVVMSAVWFLAALVSLGVYLS